MNVKFAGAALAIGLFGAACSGGDDGGSGPASPSATPSPAPDASPGDPPADTPTPSLDTDHVRELFQQWPNTDPQTLTVDPEEIVQGCFYGRDCIFAIDNIDAVDIRNPNGGRATFAPVSEVEYADDLPVAYLTINGHTRGYPLHVMTLHEIVNDEVGGVPVAVTYCPLCNTALTFDRRVDGRVLDFGVSGHLRNSDLIMFDRQTDSWWQQALGEAIAGELAGTVLEAIATSVVSYADFVRSFPNADVLTTNTGFPSTYGINPYEGYDAAGTRPFLYFGEPDGRLDALERVVTLDFGGEQLAVPFGALANSPVANVEVGGVPAVVLWAPGTLSPLDAAVIIESRDIGAAAAYSPIVDGDRLVFEPAGEPGQFTDTQTGSVWLVTGLAIEGPMAGTRLDVLKHATHFWFSWASFFPETAVWQQ